MAGLVADRRVQFDVAVALDAAEIEDIAGKSLVNIADIGTGWVPFTPTDVISADQWIGLYGGNPRYDNGIRRDTVFTIAPANRESWEFQPRAASGFSRFNASSTPRHARTNTSAIDTAG